MAHDDTYIFYEVKQSVCARNYIIYNCFLIHSLQFMGKQT